MRLFMSSIALAALFAALLACGAPEDGAEELAPQDAEEVGEAQQAIAFPLGSALGSPVTTGNTCGAFNEYTPSCASSNASDNTYTWTAPYGGTFTFTTAGSSFDTILTIRDVNNAVLACNDDVNGTMQSSVSLGLSIGQQVRITIDGYNSACGPTKLNISGPPACVWTPWYDRDDPTADGDWENRLLQSPVPCANAAAVECKTLNGVDWTQTGELATCNTAEGFYCINSNQPDGVCLDYKVRFCCP